MYATELDPKFKAIFVNVVHIYGVFVFLFNLGICTIIISNNDTRATTYRYYLASLQASSMLLDIIIASYLPIYQINFMIVYSESVLAKYIDVLTAYVCICDYSAASHIGEQTYPDLVTGPRGVPRMFRWVVLLIFAADFAFADGPKNARRAQQKRAPIVDADVPSPPIECGAHSHATSCAVCDPSCFDPVPRPCPNFCARGPPTRCECDAGYLRHGTRCIKPASCPKPCRPNQEWSRCPTPCEPSCHDPYPVCAFSTTCGTAKHSKCQCKPGFYRQSSDAEAICVPWWQCRRHGGPTPRPPLRRAPGGKAGPWNWWGPKPTDAPSH